MPTFQYPAVFLLLLLIPALYLLRKFKIFDKIKLPLTMADWKGNTFLWEKPLDRIAKFFSSTFFAIGYILLVLALADPVAITQEKIYTSLGTDILFVIDTSPSMAASDIAQTTRLQAAKQAVCSMSKDIEGAALGLVAMGNEATLVVPPTTDKNSFLSRLDLLYTGAQGDGTAIGVGISTAVYHLATSKAPKKCIVLITDGENNAGMIHPETAAKLAQDAGITLYIFGVGTSGSVPIEYVDPVSGKIYSGFLTSQFDSSILKQLAENHGGEYFGIETSSALHSALNTVATREHTTQSFHIKNTEQPYYHIFLGFAGILFVTAWILRRIYMGEQF
ncbi:MAG: VWA domain-containing protein [Spirochaetaceae bacterium]|nr:VWA domain-containing protein [Spirochaetaceae bacterium]MBO5236526.1 VWA domain-containing protein [Spirochaetaceae bacterium]